jgi:hypothetical protein
MIMETVVYVSVYRESGVLAAFEKIWGTDELIVSYDTINLTLPNAAKMGGSKPWPHVDQAPERKGLHCVQGIINCTCVRRELEIEY